jgi:hypothetical protein
MMEAKMNSVLRDGQNVEFSVYNAHYMHYVHHMYMEALLGKSSSKTF